MPTKLGSTLVVGDVVADYGKLTFVLYDPGTNDVSVERNNSGVRDTWPGSALYAIGSHGISSADALTITTAVADILQRPENYTKQTVPGGVGLIVQVPVPGTTRNVNVPFLNT